MSRPQLLQLLLLVGVLGACVRALKTEPEPQPYHPLDHRILTDSTNWTLRVNGDGSGTLSHRHYPGHHLNFPLATFPFQDPDAALLERALGSMQLAVDDQRSAVSCRMLLRELAWQPAED